MFVNHMFVRQGYLFCPADYGQPNLHLPDGQYTGISRYFELPLLLRVVRYLSAEGAHATSHQMGEISNLTVGARQAPPFRPARMSKSANE